MKTLRFLLPIFPACFALLACGGAGASGSATDDDDAALELTGEAERLATFGLASGTIASSEEAKTLRGRLLEAGGKRAYGGDEVVVAGVIAKEHPSFGRDDGRLFGIVCRAAGTEVPGEGRLSVDTCSLSAVVEMAAQDGHKLGRIDTREKENATYVAHLTGLLALEIGKVTSLGGKIKCAPAPKPTCTIEVMKGDLGSFEAALAGPLREMKRPEIGKLVGAFFPESR